jgi:hypothetical protein
MIRVDYALVASRFQQYASRQNGKSFVGIVNIEVYADETGPNSEAGVIKGKLEWAGVGGCMATVDQWAEFNVKWRKVLDDAGVPFFHFSEFADKQNSSEKKDWPYFGWSEEKRSDFLFKLATIVHGHTISSVAALVHVPSYYSELPEWYRNHIKLPQALCLKCFFTSIWGDVQEHSFKSFQEKPQEFFPAAFYFDHVDKKSNPDWYYMINALFEAQKQTAIKGYEGTPYGKLVGQVTVAEKDNAAPSSLPLEAADLVTYRMRQVQERFKEGYSTPLDEVLSEHFKIIRLDAASLKLHAAQAEKDRRFIESGII